MHGGGSAPSCCAFSGSVGDVTGAWLASAPLLHVHLNLNPGLLGEVFVCLFPETAKGYSNYNSLSGKGEHCVDSQFVV